MGLTILPYRIQTAVHSDPIQSASLRALRPLERSSIVEINARNRPISANIAQRQSSPSFLIEDIRRMNMELNPNSTRVVHYRLPQRSRSNAK
jgi:hypothetical protein